MFFSKYGIVITNNSSTFKQSRKEKLSKKMKCFKCFLMLFYDVESFILEVVFKVSYKTSFGRAINDSAS